MIIVRNKRNYKGPGIYVGRPTALCNPWPVDEKDPRLTRAKVIEYYRELLKREMKNPEGQAYKMIMQIVEMARKQEVVNLICWCAPLACHADVIKECVESIITTGRWEE